MASTTMEQRLTKLDNEIAAINAKIEDKEEKLDKLYGVNKEDRDTDQIASLEKSL